jgi:hypothetical protein
MLGAAVVVSLGTVSPEQRAATDAMRAVQEAPGDVDLTVHTPATPHDQGEQPSGEQPTRFSPAQIATLESALTVARRATQDTLFDAVIRRLAEDDDIAWDEKRLSAIPRMHRSEATAFLLGQYSDRGLWTLGDLRAYDYPNDSRTTSAVVACADTAKINIHKLKRSVRQIAGTMTHERAHAFCQRHRYNDRALDRCDFAYVAGDLTIVIDRFRANASRPVRADSRVCPALGRRLREYGVTE